MSPALVLLWLLAGGLVFLVWRRADGSDREAALKAADQLFRILPRVLMAAFAAGFLARLLPNEIVAQWIGPDSGPWGIAIAALGGLFVPAGPVVAFSLAAILAKAGAASPQLVAFITAWTIFAIHRVAGYELPMLGWRFLALRLASSVVLPVIAGLTAALLLLAAGQRAW
ncbi:MAG: hypothetical protein ACREDZ_04690 [Kiloniellales bacterium]